MDIITTKANFSSSFLFNVDHNGTFYNESISFLCVIQGNVRIEYGDFSGEFKTGDVFLMKKFGKCRLECTEKVLCLAVFFDYMFFTGEFADDFELLECNSALHPDACIGEIFSALVRLAVTHTMDPETNRFLICHQIYQVFHLLKANCLTGKEAAYGFGKMSRKQAAKLKQFVSWMKANYMSPITLSDAADYMNYTPQYLSNFIKKQLGETFNTYLSRLRLDAACNYLKFRDLPAEQVGFLCGFANTSSFRKTFQDRYLTAPEQYRAHYRDRSKNSLTGIDSFTDLSYVRDCLVNSIRIGNSASPTAIENPECLDVTCDVNNAAPLRATWQELINLGTARNFELPTFRAHLSMMQKELHFRYGRVSNIVSMVYTYYKNGRNYVFNFSRVFDIIDFILGLGLKPLFDLGDKSPDIYLPNGKITMGDPAVLDRVYNEMIPELLRACVNHYGYEEVSSWKFELWMRYSSYDLSEVEAPAVYFHRFRRVYTAVKSIVPEALVGAPGYNTFTPLEHLDHILRYMYAQGTRPDFITVYIYSFKTPPILTGCHDTPILLDEDPDFFSSRISRIREILNRNHMNSIPLYVTEYSTYISFGNRFNDSMYQASFILKQCLDNWNKVDAMGYFLVTDYANEYPGNNEFLFGGNGIISRMGIKKPGYHAFAFLSMLGNNLIAQGKHYIVTSSDNDRYQIIIYNYAHFIPHFCRYPEQYDIENYPETAMENVRPFLLDLYLTGLSAGNYKIIRYLANPEHGSIFHEWRKLDRSLVLNEPELNHLRNSCLPAMAITLQQIRDTMHIHEKINRNEICFISIEKIY